MKIAIAAAVLALVFAGLRPAAPGERITWWTTHALDKVRPFDPAPERPAHAVQLHAARNEFEPFQLVLRSGQGPVELLDVEMSDLAGPAGSIVPGRTAAVYLVRYLDLKRASSTTGAAGEWPDALIPRVDRYENERRNAFPFRLADGRNQPIWVELYVPSNAAPGDYTGDLRVTAGGKSVITAPVRLTVWNFTLPSTSSLPTSFGLNGSALVKEHFGRYTSDSDIYHLTHLYQKAALLHRISTHGGSLIAPRMKPGFGVIDWADYEREVGPFLEGQVLGENDPLPGARATSVEFRIPPHAEGAERVAYFRAWISHFRKKGWLERLYNYLWDEPTLEMYPKVVEKGRLARSAGPEVRNLVTVAFNKELADVVDIWVPLVNCLHSKPGFPDFCASVAPPEAYLGESKKGKKLWWYQSCASHGCNVVGKDYFDGWPSYMVDAPAVSNRIFPWLSWKYGIEGELYYSMNEAYGKSADAWNDVSLFGGNGDGTLFYAGRPDRVGGSRHIPIESIRLKLIREGLEDYEYLALLSRLGLTDFARRAVAEAVRTPWQWSARPEAVYEARKKMGEKLGQTANRLGTERAARAGSQVEPRPGE